MKKLRLLMVSTVLLACVGAAWGQETAEPAGIMGFSQTVGRHSFELKPEISHIKYEESLMEEEGNMYGIGGSYIFHGCVPSSGPAQEGFGWMFRGDLRYSYGQVDYDGQTGGGTPLQIDDIDDYMMEGRVLVGAEALRTSSLTTLYTGIGYRYLSDDLSEYAGGYLRESNYLYWPLGAEHTLSLGSGWALGFGGEFDVLLIGVQRTHLTDVGYSEDVDNQQTTGYGLRGSVKFMKKWEKVSLAIEGFIRYWDIDESDTEYVDGDVFWEPANESTEYGISLLITF